MPWSISIQVDPDKTTTPAVGMATATFTDTDGSVFTFSQRASFTNPNATAFRDAAIAARNDWQSKQKAAVTNAQTTLVNLFNAVAGETATAAPVK
jgi:hypothetical protein